MRAFSRTSAMASSLIRPATWRSLRPGADSRSVGHCGAVDGSDVVVGVVVAEDRPPPVVGVETVPVRAQIATGGIGGIVDVVGVAGPVPVPVSGPPRPGGGDELERPDRVVPGGVAVPGRRLGRRSDRGEPGASVEGGPRSGERRGGKGVVRTGRSRRWPY